MKPKKPEKIVKKEMIKKRAESKNRKEEILMINLDEEDNSRARIYGKSKKTIRKIKEPIRVIDSNESCQIVISSGLKNKKRKRN